MEEAWICLEFTKTRGWEARDRTDDALTDYGALARWVYEAGGGSAEVIAALEVAAAERDAEAKQVLERAKELRGAIYRIFSAVAEREAPPPESADLGELNDWLSHIAARRELVPADGGFSWAWFQQDPLPLEWVLWPIVQSAADLLTSESLDRVRLCKAEDCGWLFVDASKNRSRRWCAMSDCGNRAKVRRHRQRLRESAVRLAVDSA